MESKEVGTVNPLSELLSRPKHISVGVTVFSAPPGTQSQTGPGFPRPACGFSCRHTETNQLHIRASQAVAVSSYAAPMAVCVFPWSGFCC